VGRIVATEFVSMDGVVEDPGGSENFEHSGWSFKFDRGADGNQFKVDELRASDALLLGRITYEGFAEAWPSREDDEAGFAQKMNAMPKYVVSTTLGDPEWNNSTVIKENVPEEVSKLKDRYEGDIVIHGSGRLVRSLMEHGLVEELRLMVFPVVLGKGKRLFDGAPTTSFKLTDSKQVGSDGVTILTFAPIEPRT
jgi:dihydrofolate reductase